jgi:peptidoglycan/LPS O-acetylase OafA/YrhL
MKYIKELDAIRGFACLLILFTHLYLVNHAEIGGFRYLTGGFIGVDIFFILSGFLISTLLFNEVRLSGTINVKNFIMRRVLRLGPPIFIGVPLMILPFVFIISGWKISLYNYFYLITYTTVFPKFLEEFNLLPMPYWFPHAWSLSIEEIFYIIFPFIILKFIKRFEFLILFIIFYFVFNTMLLSYVLNMFKGGAYHNPFWHFSQIGIGVVLGYFFTNGFNKVFTGYKIFILAQTLLNRDLKYLFYAASMYILGVIVFATPISPWFYIWGAPALTLSISLILYGVISNRFNPKILKFLKLQYIGKISYGLYLYHVPIYRINEYIASKYFGFVTGENIFYSFLLDSVNVALSFLCAYLSWNIIEKKILVYKNKY